MPRILLLTMLACLFVAAPAQATMTASLDGSTMLVKSDSSLAESDITLDTGASVAVDGAGEALNATGPCSVLSGQLLCPADLVDDVRFELGGGDDTFDATDFPLSVEVLGEAGNDSIITGAGTDSVSGGPGNDFITTDDPFIMSGRAPDADGQVDCGSGNDKLNNDLADPASFGCEVIAPEFVEKPVIEGTFAVGEPLKLRDVPLAFDSPAYVTVDWYLCWDDYDCDVFSMSPLDSWVPQLYDEGAFVFAWVRANNTAGSASIRTAFSKRLERPVPLIARAPAGPAGPGGSASIPPTMSPFEPVVLQVRTALVEQAKKVAAELSIKKLRKLGKTVKHKVVLPEDGTTVVTWSVSAATARRYKVSSQGLPRVIIGRGTVRGKKGETKTAIVATTRNARKMFARARSLPVQLKLSRPATAGVIAVEADATFTLRKR